MKTYCSCQICQICTCGKHLCHGFTQPTVLPVSCPLDTLCHITEYKDKFHPHGTIPKQNYKKICHEYRPLEGEISADTTFQSDYVAHPPRERSPRPIKTYVAPTGIMLLKTTYLNDFRTYPNYKNTIAGKVEEYKAPTTKMDTLSAYSDAYCAWEPQKQRAYKNTDNIKVKEGLLDMASTSQADYCLKTQPSTRKSFKPDQKLKKSTPFEGNSVYRQTYIPHPVQAKPPNPRMPYKPSSSPFQALSTHRHDYKGDRSSVAQSCKVKTSWEPRSTPFEGTSECHDKFQVWPLRCATKSHKAAGYSPPDGAMELTSIAHTDFRGAPGRPATSAQPSIRAWSKGKPFEARSTTQDHFRAWEEPKRYMSLKPPPRRLPVSAFEDTSTFRAEYTPKKVKSTTSFKPVQRILSPCGMECDTLYRSTFKKHKVQPCPASFCDRPEGQVLSLGKNGYILCQNIPPEEPKVISRSSSADIAKSCHPMKSRLVQSAGIYRGKA